MIKKTLLILPYFGNLPNYFNIYLKSVRFNSEFNWLLVTDDRSAYDYPQNMTVVYKSFEELRALFKSKFDFNINLDTPFKLCDFRPSFGYVFGEYLTDYDYWGHCDPDIVWGRLSHFIDYDQLCDYDKIFTLGHLSIYKNTAENNLRFLKTIEGKKHYKKVFSAPYAFGYDELFNKSINTIFITNDFPLFTTNYAADIDPYYSAFRLNTYNDAGDYRLERKLEQFFLWKDGIVNRYFLENGQLHQQEFCYIHLQKRAMTNNSIGKSDNHFIILPFRFMKIDEPLTFLNFSDYYTKIWFNRQYFRVKFKSFKFKMKHFNHFYSFSSLFKK